MLMVTLILSISFVMISCKESDLKKVTVCEVTHSVFYAPLYVAMELGYFKEEGLEIELVNGNGADKVMAALLSGDADIGLMGPEASIYVYLKGQVNYAINFAQLTRTDGSFIIGRTNNKTFTLEDLKGKTILGGRVGGVPEMTLEYVLKKNGLLVGRDDPKVLENNGVMVRTDVQFAAMAGAFSSGEGDYTTLFEPTATTLENNKKGYVLASVGKYAGDVPYTCFSALKNYIEKNDDTLTKFTRAIYKAQQWVSTNDALSIATVVKGHFSSNTLEELTTVMQRHKDIDAWSVNPLLKESSLNNLMDIMIEANELTSYVDYNKIVTTKYASLCK